MLGTVAQTWCYHITSYFSIVLPDCNAALEMGLLTAAAATQQHMKAWPSTPAGTRAKFAGQIQRVGLAWWKPEHG